MAGGLGSIIFYVPRESINYKVRKQNYKKIFITIQGGGCLSNALKQRMKNCKHKVTNVI